jgi:NitT/TauT family transport system substrate-binding protein
MTTVGARPVRRPMLAAFAILVVAVVFAAAAAGAQGGSTATTASLTVGVLPIANTLPLDLGIKKGFFEQQGIEIKKITAQSGNDIMLGLANSNMDVGFAGWVPAMIARTSGIPISAITLSEVESTNQATNWQNIVVKGSSSIRTPADLAGKTIAVNALKGVGEVMIKAALEKSGVDPNSIKLLALPFPAMRAALQSGQVDAIWTPEPFLSQAIQIDGARDLMAPGPILGDYWR